MVCIDSMLMFAARNEEKYSLRILMPIYSLRIGLIQLFIPMIDPAPNLSDDLVNVISGFLNVKLRQNIV